MSGRDAAIFVSGGLVAFLLWTWPRRAFAGPRAAAGPSLVPDRTRSLTITVAPDYAWESGNYAAAVDPLTTHFRAAEERYDLPAGLLSRVAYQESRYDVNAVSPKGAVGLMQFLPSTAAQLGFDPRDPAASIDGAGRYLQQLHQQTGSWTGALAAYNWGIGNLRRQGFANAPAETVSYVRAIAQDVRLG